MILSDKCSLTVLHSCLLPCDLFLNGFCVGFSKQVQQNTAEVVRVAIRVPQLVCNSVQE